MAADKCLGQDPVRPLRRGSSYPRLPEPQFVRRKSPPSECRAGEAEDETSRDAFQMLRGTAFPNPRVDTPHLTNCQNNRRVRRPIRACQTLQHNLRDAKLYSCLPTPRLKRRSALQVRGLRGSNKCCETVLSETRGHANLVLDCLGNSVHERRRCCRAKQSLRVLILLKGSRSRSQH